MSLRSLTEGYRESNQDSCIYFAQELLNLSRKLDFKLDQGFALAQWDFLH